MSVQVIQSCLDNRLKRVFVLEKKIIFSIEKLLKTLMMCIQTNQFISLFYKNYKSHRKKLYYEKDN